MQVQTDGDGSYVTATEIPFDVYVVCDADDGDFLSGEGTADVEDDWSLNTYDHTAQPFGSDPSGDGIAFTNYDEPFISTRINVDTGHAGSSVRVDYAPRTLVELRVGTFSSAGISLSVFGTLSRGIEL